MAPDTDCHWAKPCTLAAAWDPLYTLPPSLDIAGLGYTTGSDGMRKLAGTDVRLKLTPAE